MKKIYFDYAATTPIDPRVFAAMRPYFGARFGNAGSLHSFGQEAMGAVDKSRETIARTFGVDFRNIIFTGSATEANNLALRGTLVKFQRAYAEIAMYSLPRRILAASRPADPAMSGGRARPGSESSRHTPAETFEKIVPRIIISSIEHESVLETARDLERSGAEVVYVPVNKQGIVDVKKIKEALNERTVLVSVMCANNETGAIQPIQKIAEIIKGYRVQGLGSRVNQNSRVPSPYPLYPIFHTDAVQALQFFDCSPEMLCVDLVTISAHKIYGPKGIGALVMGGPGVQGLGSRVNQNSLVPSAYSLCPITTGGGQEFGFRSGTENVPLIVGFAKALELIEKDKDAHSVRIATLSKRLYAGIKKIYPKAVLNGSTKLTTGSPAYAEDRLPNILNVYIPGVEAQDMLIKLDLNGVAISSGSACRSRSPELSHVLTAMGCSKARMRESIRISIGRPTTREEIDKLLSLLRKLKV